MRAEEMAVTANGRIRVRGQPRSLGGGHRGRGVGIWITEYRSGAEARKPVAFARSPTKIE